MKQVWVKSATWAWTASTTRGEALPMVVTAIPEPRSMSELPSALEDAAAGATASIGTVCPTPAATAAALRASSASDLGPGMR